MEGLVQFQLQANNPNTPFASVLQDVGSVLESHARLQGRYTPARVAAAATDSSFMPSAAQGPGSPTPSSLGGDGSQDQ